MAEYLVHLIDDGGSPAQRRVDAVDAHDAVSQLRVAPSRVLSVHPLVLKSGALPAQSRGSSRFPLRLFSQELAVLLAAGIPLLEGLVTLREKESSARVGEALDGVIQMLQDGQPLSAALRSQPQAFDALFVAVVQSSERTGQTAHALREHAAYLAWVDTLRSKLVSASVYPITLVVAGLVVVLFLLLFVVPRFAGILEGVSGDIPPASRWLISLGHASGEHPWTTVGMGVALLATPVLAWQQAGVRNALTTRLWQLPLLGPKLHLLALAQFYRTGSMLLGAGVPVVTALQTARGVIASRLAPPLDAAIELVQRGERLSAALQQQGLTTPVSLRMLRVGESSGELGAMLGQAAQFYDEELSRLTDLVTRLVNPVLMLIMGVVIGTIVVLMYLPIFQLVEQVQ